MSIWTCKQRRGEEEEAEVAHWQLNSGDLLNSRWHARHGGHKEAANIKLRQKRVKRFILHFMTWQFAAAAWLFGENVPL